MASHDAVQFSLLSNARGRDEVRLHSIPPLSPFHVSIPPCPQSISSLVPFHSIIGPLPFHPCLHSIPYLSPFHSSPPEKSVIVTREEQDTLKQLSQQIEELVTTKIENFRTTFPFGCPKDDLKVTIKLFNLVRLVTLSSARDILFKASHFVEQTELCLDMGLN